MWRGNPDPRAQAETHRNPGPHPTAVATEAEVQEATAIPFTAVTVDDDTTDVGTFAVAVGGGIGD